ncbi:MAG TPA: hypothetical protein VIU16_02950 [Gaiellaceae bacterium]
MAFIEIPYRIASRARFYAGNLADSFAALLAAVNGGLDARNYAPGARIPNAMKTNPRAVFALQMHLSNFAAGTYIMRVPGPIGLGALLVEPFQWDVVLGYGKTLTGTAKLYMDGVQRGTTKNYADPAGPNRISTEAIVMAPVSIAGLYVEIVVASVTGVSPGDLSAIVWCKAPHVR